MFRALVYDVIPGFDVCHSLPFAHPLKPMLNSHMTLCSSFITRRRGYSSLVKDSYMIVLTFVSAGP